MYMYSIEQVFKKKKLGRSSFISGQKLNPNYLEGFQILILLMVPLFSAYYIGTCYMSVCDWPLYQTVHFCLIVHVSLNLTSLKLPSQYFCA